MDDYYAIVGVEPTAGAELIANRVREQLRVWQQRTASADLDRRHQAEQRLRQLRAARSVLLDPENRLRYDRELTAERTSAARPNPPAIPPPDPPSDGVPGPLPSEGPSGSAIEDEAAVLRRRRFGTLPEPVPPDEWIGESDPGVVPYVPPDEPLGTPYAG